MGESFDVDVAVLKYRIPGDHRIAHFLVSTATRFSAGSAALAIGTDRRNEPYENSSAKFGQRDRGWYCVGSLLMTASWIWRELP
jgi:hypothetical protein